MSSTGYVYRIYAESVDDHDLWSKADEFLNGVQVKFDLDEALAVAKVAALSTQCPIVIQQLPRHGIRKGLYPVWVEYPKHHPYD